MKLIKRVRRWLIVTAGAAIAAFGIGSFLAANGVMVGGVSGIATVVNYMTGFPVGVTALLLNIPIFIAGIIILGRRLGVDTVYACLVFSAFIDVFGQFVLTDDVFLAAVFGGVLTGSGFGLVFLHGATTGGVDVVAKIIKKYQRHLPLGRIMFSVDIITILASMFLFKNINVGLYSAIALWISTSTMDLILQGLHFATLVFVVSGRAEEMSAVINQKLERGVTVLNGYGAYSKLPKGVLMCSVRQRQIPFLKDIIHRCDAGAFMIVTDAREVLGEGFQAFGALQ